MCYTTLHHFLSISLDEQRSIMDHILLLCVKIVVCTKLARCTRIVYTNRVIVYCLNVAYNLYSEL